MITAKEKKGLYGDEINFAAAKFAAQKVTQVLTSPTGLREEEYSLKPRTVSSGCL